MAEVRGRPLFEAVVVVGLVLGSFLLSALLVLWKSETESRHLSARAVEASAWRAVAEVAETVGPVGFASAQAATEAAAALARIRAEDPGIRCLAILVDRGEGLQILLSDGSSPVLENLETLTAEHAAASSEPIPGTPMALSSGGSGFVVYAPMSAEHRRFVRSEGGPAPRGPSDFLILLPVGGIGATIAALVGFLVYSSSGKFHLAYRQLAEAEKRMRDVTSAAGEYIWEVNAAGRYTFLSGRVYEVLGYHPEELIGRHPFELFGASTSAEARERSDFIVRHARPFRDFVHQMLRKDGRSIWLSVNGVPVIDAEGELLGFRGAAMDITARKHSEEALIREKEAAQAAAVAKSQFLAMMSHEIRTPLNSVLGFTELLTNSGLSPAQREHLEMIKKSGDGLLVLLNDILEFSRTESGSLMAKPEPTETRPFLQSVLSLHEPLAKSKGLPLSLVVADAVPEWLSIDQARFRQILLNLIGNAVKFTERGSVAVRAERNPSGGEPMGFPLKISVTDTGIGIPSDKVDRLFKPFSQVDSSTTRRFGGTGLGLAICRRLAALFGGTVALESSSPEGSTFTLCCVVPLASKPASKSLSGEIHPIESAASLRVLVAEDNPASRKLMQIMLSKMGVEFDAAHDGREAVEKHRSKPFDLIFMDVQMPIMDGISATREIRCMEEEGRVKTRATIIALTADALAGDRERCLRAGMDDYLTKPIRKESLTSAIRKHASRA